MVCIYGVKSNVGFRCWEMCVCVSVCVCVCVCVCEREQDESCNRHTHHGMYGVRLFIIHGHAYTWRRSGGYHQIAARPYLVGSQAIKAASYKVFAAV